MTASWSRSRFSIFRRSTALAPAPPTPTSLIAMLRSVRSACSRGSSLRFMAGSGVGEEPLHAGEESAAAARAHGFLGLRAHAVVKQPQRRVIAGVAEVFADPHRGFAEVRRHIEDAGRRF